MKKLPALIKDALEATGLPYELVGGGQHMKLKLAGRLVGILPNDGRRNDSHRRTELNTVAQIRRAAAEMKGTL